MSASCANSSYTVDVERANDRVDAATKRCATTQQEKVIEEGGGGQSKILHQEDIYLNNLILA